MKKGLDELFRVNLLDGFLMRLLGKRYFRNSFFIYLSMLRTPSAIAKPSGLSIRYNQFVRYIRIGAFLHVMGLVGIALFL